MSLGVSADAAEDAAVTSAADDDEAACDALRIIECWSRSRDPPSPAPPTSRHMQMRPSTLDDANDAFDPGDHFSDETAAAPISNRDDAAAAAAAPPAPGADIADAAEPATWPAEPSDAETSVRLIDPSIAPATAHTPVVSEPTRPRGAPARHVTRASA